MTATLVLALALAAASINDPVGLDGPDGRLRLDFRIDEKGEPGFDLAYRGTPIASGALGLSFVGAGPNFAKSKVVGTERASVDLTYTIPVGKSSTGHDRHHELIVRLENDASPPRKLGIAFRAFPDGIAFRYLLPEGDFTLRDELTRLTFPGGPTATYLPLKNFTTSYEGYYKTGPIAGLDPGQLIAVPVLLEPAPAAAGAARRPWIAVTEADLDDFAGMYLGRSRDDPATLITHLSPLPGRRAGMAAAVVGRGPKATPWRVLMIGDDPGRLIESNIVFHLNPPCRIADTSWIKPGKTTFPWWNGYASPDKSVRGAVDTATMLRYIDFCAAEKIPYHSLDGLDIAWYGGPIQPSGPTDITRAAPSIDMPALLAHAKAKGVRLRVWLHWLALKPQIDEAFATYEKWGLEGVMVDFMDRDDQEMVRFYHEMADKAAKHHLTVTLHGAYKPTGLERTYPNVLTYEAALNQEYNKWEKPGEPGTPPLHNLNIAFVRMLAGPLDYHQGGMRSVLPEQYRPSDKLPPVQGTRGHQLAMYVVYQNHLPMMADDPAAYANQPGLDFLVDVPCTWDETRVLVAEPGRCLVIARRKGGAWYLGGMTAAEGREVDLPMAFLAPGEHEASLHLDDPAGGPNALARSKRPVSAADTLKVKMPPSGGFAARIARPGAAGR